MDQQSPRNPPIARPRHDGWTHDKQVTFIVALRRTRNVTRAAAAAGMSRESAYRLRARPSAAGFAAAWDLALRHDPERIGHNESHERHAPAASSVGFPPRKHHESHGSGRIAPHHQLHQLPARERAGSGAQPVPQTGEHPDVPSTGGRLSRARRAELLALIERAGRG